MISGAVLPMQSFPGDVCGLRVSQLVCFDQWLRLSSCLCVCSVFNWTMCAITKHFKDPLSHLDRILINSDDHDHPDQIRDVLLLDPALRGPELAPREEQDVQEGVHQEHQGRCRRRR